MSTGIRTTPHAVRHHSQPEVGVGKLHGRGVMSDLIHIKHTPEAPNEKVEVDASTHSPRKHLQGSQDEQSSSEMGRLETRFSPIVLRTIIIPHEAEALLCTHPNEQHAFPE